ncbi:MAG: glycosyltransferase [Patescibacteria group bacterium]
MKIALVTEILTQYGGGERVLDAFLEIWPAAPIYTLVYDPAKMSQFYSGRDIRPSFIQKLPGMPSHYKWALPLMPKAAESFDFSEFDVVLSNSSAYVKGVITRPPTVHISYVLTPTRYLWSDRDEYLKNAPVPGWLRPFMPPVLSWLKRWDYKAAARADVMIGDSKTVAERIHHYYGRRADGAIFPPVDTKRFTPAKKVGDYWFVVSRQEPYKRTDLAIAAANKLGLPLIVAGGGTRVRELESLAGPTIKFVGRVSDEELAKLYAEAIGLIFPQEEDAGITPLESMAAGRPVIAYGRGGARETVIPGLTGEFFDVQTVDSLAATLSKFDPSRYDSAKIRAHAETFDTKVFQAKIQKVVEEAYTKILNSKHEIRDKHK